MAFSLFTKQKPNGQLTLLVDIGSASVGAAFVIIENGKVPRIIESVRTDILFQEALTSARFLSAMNHALDRALKSLLEKVSQSDTVPSGQSIGIPAHVFCTLSSPWFILKTRNLLISREEEFEVNERILEEFINSDIELLKEELAGTLPPQDVRIIEKKIIHIKLNGYEIKNPYKQKTSRMGLSVTIGVSSGKVIQSIERKISNFFHTKSAHFGVFPVAAFSVIRDMFPDEKNFLFLDITGEATDVSRVDNDVLVKTVSFPSGKNFFVREISARMRTIHEEANTLFSMFLRDELDTEKRIPVAELMAQSEGKWLSRFEKAIISLAEKGALPRKVFFTADADLVSFFSWMMTKVESPLLMGGSFDVQYLDQLIVSKFVTFEPEVIRDPFLVIEALFAQKLISQHD